LLLIFVPLPFDCSTQSDTLHSGLSDAAVSSDCSTET
jgi:hypothetical protein